MSVKEAMLLDPPKSTAQKSSMRRRAKAVATPHAHPSPKAEVVKEKNEWGPLPKELWPKVDHLVTEDDTPVDNIFSEKQQKFGTITLYETGEPFGKGRKFVALANVGLYNSPDEPPQVPDIMVSLDVSLPADVWEKGNRSYLIWLYGKPPEVVIEIVSNKTGGEETTRKHRYARMRITYYVVYDPERQLSNQVLRVYELRGTKYVLRKDHWMPWIGLGLTLWRGVFEDLDGEWLRWCDKHGNVLLTGHERAEQETRRADQESQRAEQESQRANQESQRAEQERQRADQLAAKLRSLGIDPDSISNL